MFQKIFQNSLIEDIQYVSIVNESKTYVDTFDNFILDRPTYPLEKDQYIFYNIVDKVAIDSEGKFIEDVSYPELDSIVEDIDSLIKSQYDRDNPFILSDYKKEAIDILSTKRKEAETEVIIYNDFPISYDDDSRDRLRIARQGLELTGDESVTWTSGDDGEIMLTLEDINQIYIIAYKRGESLHKKYKTAQSEIESNETNTKEKVDEIVDKAFI